MRIVPFLAALTGSAILVACGGVVAEPAPDLGGHFTLVDATGPHTYVAEPDGVECSTVELLDGKLALQVSFPDLDELPTGSLWLMAAPFSADTPVYDGENWIASELESVCDVGPCLGVFWRSSEGKEQVSTLGTHHCQLEVTYQTSLVVGGKFECAQLLPDDYVIRDGEFACVLRPAGI